MSRLAVLLTTLIFILASCSSGSQKQGPPPVKVQAGEVKEQEVRYFVDVIGSVNQLIIVQIKPQVEGILEKIHVKEGSFVKAGDLLYEIDKKPFQAALDQAEGTLQKDIAALEIAKSTAARYAEPASKDYVSPLVYEQYLTNVKSAEAQVVADKAAVESARINLGYCTITSPISGKVSAYQVDAGNLVTVNNATPLTEIRQIEPVQILFSIPQKDFQAIKDNKVTKTLTFEVTLPYSEEYKSDGTVYFIDNHIDEATGTILLKGLVPNKDHALWPGEYVRVRLFTKSEPHAIVAPYAALQQSQKGAYVYVINADMTVKKVAVETGDQLGNIVVIRKGLKAGDRVVTNGQMNLRNESKVVMESSTK